MRIDPPPAADGARIRVAVVILNWRRPDDTLACLASVAALDHALLDIMICDNASGDGSIERIAAGVAATLPMLNAARAARGYPPFEVAEPATPDEPPPVGDACRLWIVPTGRNGGYAFGNNIGIRLGFLHPDAAFAWILNNDTVVDPAALGSLLAYAATDPTIAICGARVLYLERPDRVQSLGGGLFRPARTRCEQVGEGARANDPVDHRAIEASLSYVNGAAALVRRDFVERVGAMDEGYFLYWEELDWATRARAAGFRLGFCPEAIVYHQVGAATGSSDEGFATLSSTYWMTRSRFRYLRLHRPALLALAFPLLAKAMVRTVLRGGGGGARRAGVMLRAALGLPMAGQGS